MCLNEDPASPAVVWKVYKATSRGEYTSAIKAARTEYASQTNPLEECGAKAAATSPKFYSFWAQARRKLKIFLTHSDARTL